MLLPTASILLLIATNHLYNNNYSVYNLYHLLSRLPLISFVCVESIIIIYCSYCVDFYCQTQGKKLFACDSLCVCFFYLFYWVWEISQKIIFYWVWGSLKISFYMARFEDLPKFYLLSLRISKTSTSTEFKDLYNLHFYWVWKTLKS